MLISANSPPAFREIRPRRGWENKRKGRENGGNGSSGAFCMTSSSRPCVPAWTGTTGKCFAADTPPTNSHSPDNNVRSFNFWRFSRYRPCYRALFSIPAVSRSSTPSFPSIFSCPLLFHWYLFVAVFVSLFSRCQVFIFTFIYVFFPRLFFGNETFEWRIQIAVYTAVIFAKEEYSDAKPSSNKWWLLYTNDNNLAAWWWWIGWIRISV